MFKNLLMVVALLVAVDTFAASVVVTSTNGPTSIIQGGCKTSQIIIANTNTTANSMFYFFDSPTNVITYTNAAYTNITQSVGQVTNIYTNYFNVPTTNVFAGAILTTNTVIANTNNYPLMLNVLVPSNTTMTVDFVQKFTFGVTVTNQAGGNITVTYSQ